MSRILCRAPVAGILLAAVLIGTAAPARAVTIQKVVSPGGIAAWFVRDRSVPIISMNFVFKGAAALDPAGKEGLADMVSGLLDEGAGDLDSQAFQRALEDISASIGFDAGRDRFSGTLRSLSVNRDKAFDLLRLALTAPRFDKDPVERIRAQLIANLLDEQENPRRIAGRTWFRAAFPGHPYGRPVAGTRKSVSAITRADLKRFVAGRFARDNLLIGVVGDIAPDELGRRLDAVFGALPAKSAPAKIAEAAPAAAGRLIVVRKKIPQSVVLFGQKGVKRDDPDYYAAYVLNYILGGGSFSSRLMVEIRVKRGLVYSIYSYLHPLDHSALIMGALATKNAQVANTLGILRREWRRIGEEGVGAEELAAAKTYINGSFPLRLDSGRSIASMLVAIQVSKLGIDYIDKRPGYINAVTAADVKRVARRLLDPDKLTVVVVGEPEGLDAGK